MKLHRTVLDQAVEREILSSKQASELWEFIVNSGEATRFNAVNLLYYVGGVLIFLAVAFYLSLAWSSYGLGVMLTVILTLAVAFGWLGYLAWFKRGMKVAGGILFTAVVCTVPLIAYCIFGLLGLWPEKWDGADFHEYHRVIRSYWLGVSIATIAVAGGLLRYVAFPFLTMPIAIALAYIAMDIVPALFGVDFTWDERKMVAVFFGLAMMALAFWIDRKTKEDFAFWLYLFGLITFWGGLSLMDSQHELGKFFYFLVNLFLMALSVYLRRVMFVVFGGLGAIAYLGYLAHQVFRTYIGFSLALVVIGLIMIYMGMQYQRNQQKVEAVLNARLPDPFKQYRPRRKK